MGEWAKQFTQDIFTAIKDEILREVKGLTGDLLDIVSVIIVAYIVLALYMYMARFKPKKIFNYFYFACIALVIIRLLRGVVIA